MNPDELARYLRALKHRPIEQIIALWGLGLTKDFIVDKKVEYDYYFRRVGRDGSILWLRYPGKQGEWAERN